jgi:hypothetical protein
MLLLVAVDGLPGMSLWAVLAIAGAMVGAIVCMFVSIACQVYNCILIKTNLLFLLPHFYINNDHFLNYFDQTVEFSILKV